MPTKLFIFGAGGHGKVVLDALYAISHSVVLFDNAPDKVGSMLLKNIIQAVPEDFSGMHGHVAIGDNQVRRRLVSEVCAVGARLLTVLHPNSVVSASAEVGDGCFIAASAVVGPDAVLAEGCIVNHGAVVDHDARVGRYCHIAPNAALGGQVVVGDEVLIGSGAVILPGVRVGNGAKIGSGAVVTRDVNAGQIMVGIPARSMYD